MSTPLTTPVFHRTQRPFQFAVQYDTIAEYRRHFCDRYCTSHIETFDKIPVLFEPDDFDHAFYEGDAKELFSRQRAERIDWIDWALDGEFTRPVCGWDSHRWRPDWNRRVSLVDDDYVVVVEFIPSGCLRFVTAYIATPERVRRLRRLPRWR